MSHKDEVAVHASDCAQIALKLQMAVAARRKPAYGNWAGIEERLDAAANTLMEIYRDVTGVPDLSWPEEK